MRWLFIGLVAASLVGCGSDDSQEPASTPDTRAQALSFAKDNLPCTTEADCCVVFDGCRSQGLIVANKDKDTVTSLIASAPKDLCVGCIAPAVQIKCVSGLCSGVTLTPGAGADISAGESARKDHCGAVTVPTGWIEGTQSTVPISQPGLNPTKVLGCT